MSAPDTRTKALARRVARGAVAHYEDAAYYDLAYKRRRDDVRFYVELARGLRGAVLELGAGTGRVALPLAESGRTVVAVEPVKAMRDRAREKLAALPEHVRTRVTLRQGDARSLRLGATFPLVLMPFNVFMHLYTRADAERALATVRAHLAPRGRFAFDVSMPDLRAMSRSPGRLYRGPRVVHPRTGQRYDYFEAFEYDTVRQIQHVSMVYQNLEQLDDLRSLPLSQRQFFPEELATLLHYNGFSIVARHGDFAGAPLREDSESQIVVARTR